MHEGDNTVVPIEAGVDESSVNAARRQVPHLALFYLQFLRHGDAGNLTGPKLCDRPAAWPFWERLEKKRFFCLIHITLIRCMTRLRAVFMHRRAWIQLSTPLISLADCLGRRRSVGTTFAFEFWLAHVATFLLIVYQAA